MKQAVLSLSGGMDSTGLLTNLLANNYEVTCLSFDYGQKHDVELERAKANIKYLSDLGYKVTQTVVDLTSITKLLNSNLVKGGEDVPEGHYENENMKETVVPNRNKMMISIVQAVALSIANEQRCTVEIAMGIHAGDHAVYPDCRQEFRDADYAAFVAGNWDADRVKYYTPYLDTDKEGILKDTALNCNKLAISFNEVLRNTNTSYKPILIGSTWYSDYKSASSVERVEAFINLGLVDPVEYADESGPVSWEVVKNSVSLVLENA